MPVTQKREAIALNQEQIQKLQRILSSQNGSRSAMVRARVLLRYTRGEAIRSIARKEGITRPTVQLCIDKALSGGIERAIQDLPRSGRRPVVTVEGKAWVMQLACSRPMEHGYNSEVWTLSRLTAHVRKHARDAGHVSLDRASKYMIRRIIKESPDSPHNVACYFDRRSLESGEETASVLIVVKEILLFHEGGTDMPSGQVGIGEHEGARKVVQATDISADLAPEPNSHPLWFQNNDCRRVGTMSLMAGIDLHDGRVLGLVQRVAHRGLRAAGSSRRYSSSQAAPKGHGELIRNKNMGNRFGEFLKLVDSHYPSNWRIRIVPGDGSAAASRNTIKALRSYPNRFELDEPHSEGLWLNLVQVFFTRMLTSFLRSLRVKSSTEFIDKMNQYLEEINLFTIVDR
jgi:hypothetical protein